MRTEQKPLNTGLGERTLPGEVMGSIRLDGKTVLITGGHSGIGLLNTKALSQAGARIVVGARDVEKARLNLDGLRNVVFEPLDLSVPGSIDAFTAKFLGAHSKLDILINNAGIMAIPALTREARGYELQFATNHLGHFQLTAGLWEALKRADGSRVICLSSYGHRFSDIHFEDIHFNQRPYDKWLGYGQSKTANSLFAVELDKRGRPFGVRSFAVHPGRIPGTDLLRFMTPEEQRTIKLSVQAPPQDGIHLKSVEEGSSTTLWAAVSPLLADKGGVYCADCDISPLVREESPLGNTVRDYAVDSQRAGRLWEVSETAAGVTFS